MFVRLPSLYLGVFLLCTRLSKHSSAVHSVVIDSSLIKLVLKFRNVLKLTESLSSLACNQNIKEDIPTTLEVLFETERSDIN